MSVRQAQAEIDSEEFALWMADYHLTGWKDGKMRGAASDSEMESALMGFAARHNESIANSRAVR